MDLPFCENADTAKNVNKYGGKCREAAKYFLEAAKEGGMLKNGFNI